jgi:hypothetical protein
MSSLNVASSHKEGDLIRLSVKNLDFTMDNIVWYVDGEISEDAYISPAAGKHQICAVLTDTEGKDGLDFVIDFPAGEDLVILQITDTQMQAVKGARNATRRTQISNAFFSNGLGRSHDKRVWRYTDEAVERVKPDLIVLTGDNIYGELDDSGEMWLELIGKMDSYGIPWCVVFGNHDNESGKGVRWQVEQLMESEYCIFKQGSVSGNSNYNLLIRQGGEAKYLLYMLDSNGCKVKPSNPG